MSSKYLVGLSHALAMLLVVPALANEGPTDAGKTYRVPYKLSETNHFIVRVKLNGKGPFNLVVDTGAPALYLSTEAAKQAGIETDPEEPLSRVDSLEIEGAARLDRVQARIEDVFQLVGMNALGLPGVRIDGMLGFNVLARYRIVIDPTNDRMDWTRLDHDPPDIVVPKQSARAGARTDVQALNLLGGVAKFAAAFIGKQPEDQLIPRGFAGVELAEADGHVSIARVLPGSPAETAGLNQGDLVLNILGREIRGLGDVRRAVSRIELGDKITIRIRPANAPADSEPVEHSIIATEGL